MYVLRVAESKLLQARYRHQSSLLSARDAGEGVLKSRRDVAALKAAVAQAKEAADMERFAARKDPHALTI